MKAMTTQEVTRRIIAALPAYHAAQYGPEHATLDYTDCTELVCTLLHSRSQYDRAIGSALYDASVSMDIYQTTLVQYGAALLPYLTDDRFAACVNRPRDCSQRYR